MTAQSYSSLRLTALFSACGLDCTWLESSLLSGFLRSMRHTPGVASCLASLDNSEMLHKSSAKRNNRSYCHYCQFLLLSSGSYTALVSMRVLLVLIHGSRDFQAGVVCSYSPLAEHGRGSAGHHR